MIIRRTVLTVYIVVWTLIGIASIDAALGTDREARTSSGIVATYAGLPGSILVGGLSVVDVAMGSDREAWSVNGMVAACAALPGSMLFPGLSDEAFRLVGLGPFSDDSVVQFLRFQRACVVMSFAQLFLILELVRRRRRRSTT